MRLNLSIIIVFIINLQKRELLPLSKLLMPCQVTKVTMRKIFVSGATRFIGYFARIIPGASKSQPSLKLASFRLYW